MDPLHQVPKLSGHARCSKSSLDHALLISLLPETGQLVSSDLNFCGSGVLQKLPQAPVSTDCVVSPVLLACLSREPTHQIWGFQTSRALAVSSPAYRSMVLEQSWDGGSRVLGLQSRCGRLLWALSLMCSTKLALLATRNGQRHRSP